MAGVPHPEPLSCASYSAVELSLDNDRVILLEQRELPTVERYLSLADCAEVVAAITDMVVRGAPAIGITAAYGMVVAAAKAPREPSDFSSHMTAAAAGLKASRPTAVNLAWAVDAMLQLALSDVCESAEDRVELLADRARRIHRDDVEACRRMGAYGAERVPDGARILTHCNAGALATGGYGTALGVIRAAHELGKAITVLADETRPYLQGARLTAWELHRDGIPVEVIADSASGALMRNGQIDLAVVGSDRVASNGDVANKIGTYNVAVLCRAHELPFYVAAPWSTVDMACVDGNHIPIEERAAEEISMSGERRMVASGIGVRTPAFDVTPASLVSALFTERGVASPLGPASLNQIAPQVAAKSRDSAMEAKRHV